MKRLYVLTLATVMVAGTVTAQRSYTGTAVPMVPFNIGAGGERSNLDSIYYEEAFGATATWSGVIFTINGAAGYVYGNNFYADKAKALAFMLGDLHPGIGHNVT